MTETGAPPLYRLFEGQRGMGVLPVHSVSDSLALLRGEMKPASPIQFRHAIGRVPRDLMMGGDVSLLLISERFRSILAREAFTGWATYQVEVRSKRGEIIPGYSGLAIVGRSRRVGRLAVAAAALTNTTDGLVRRGWAGDDLYLDGRSAMIVVTARVRDALLAARITNVSFEPVE